MQASEAAKLVAMVVAHYPATRAQFTVESAQAFRAGIVEYPLTEASIGVARVLRTARFLPSVAELRSAITDVIHGPPRSGVEAWGDVVEAIRRFGSYQRPRFADPGVAEVVRQMGWVNLCRGENEASDRARFVDAYDHQEARRREDVVSGHQLPPARGYAQLTQGEQHVERERLGPKPANVGTGPQALGAILSRREEPDQHGGNR